MSKLRFTIDLDPKFDATLTELAREKHTTKADIIRNALATYSFISGQALHQKGQKLSITDNSDRVLKDIVIP